MKANSFNGQNGQNGQTRQNGQNGQGQFQNFNGYNDGGNMNYQDQNQNPNYSYNQNSNQVPPSAPNAGDVSIWSKASYIGMGFAAGFIAYPIIKNMFGKSGDLFKGTFENIFAKAEEAVENTSDFIAKMRGGSPCTKKDCDDSADGKEKTPHQH